MIPEVDFCIKRTTYELLWNDIVPGDLGFVRVAIKFAYYCTIMTRSIWGSNTYHILWNSTCLCPTWRSFHLVQKSEYSCHDYYLKCANFNHLKVLLTWIPLHMIHAVVHCISLPSIVLLKGFNLQLVCGWPSGFNSRSRRVMLDL